MGHISTLFAVLLYLFATFLALPVRAENTLLSSQNVSVQGDDLRVEIRFEQAMNYISHFPEQRGSQLDIKLRPILTAQTGSIMASVEDRLSVGNHAGNPLRDIQYEQDERGNGVLSIQFNHEYDYKIATSRDNQGIDIILLHAGKEYAANQNASLPLVKVDSGLPIYVLNLETEPQPIDPDKQPILKNFRGKYDIYAIHTQQGRKTLYQLRLGYFHSLKLAKANASRLRPFYPEVWVDRVKEDRRLLAENWFLKQNIDRLQTAEFHGKEKTAAKPVTKPTTKPTPPSTKVAVPSLTKQVATPTTQAPAAASTPTAATGGKSDKQSKLMETAKQAMISQNYRTAISYFTHILQDPDPTYHQEAQELLGLAWERLNLPAQAVAEYQKYLKQYPTGPDSDRVKQRLTGLLTAKSKPVAKLAAAPTPAKSQGPTPTWDFFGSFSQYYRNQQFATDVTSATTIDNSLTSNLALSGRRRGLEWDQRVDFAASHRYDFQNKLNASDGNIYSLFYDLADKHDDVSMRIGRQTHNSDGVYGRFDGVIVNKRIGHNKKLSLLAGFPVDNITINDSINTSRKFYAASVKFESLIKNLDTKFYYINQTNDGMIDRTAIGNQTQYVDNFKTMYFNADYDIHYKQLNQATFVGNWRSKDSTNYNVTADYRNSPLLTTNNALIGQTTATTLEQLRQTFTLTEVEQLAKDRTGVMKSLTVAVSRPLSARYQLNGDATISNTSGTPASGGVDATDSTGNQYYYNINLIANNFLTNNDLSIMGLRYYTDITSRTTSANFSSRFNLNKNWRLNPRMAIELRDINGGSKRTTYLPRVVIQDRAARNWRFEMEFGYEYSTTSAATGNTTEKSYYGYLGYTHDF
jgi:tetratricopeptide (TPR) repeat protein